MNAVRSHRDTYPEQYRHPLCGKRVRVVHNGKEIARGTVERVMASRFGMIAALDDFDRTQTGYLASECEET